MYQQAARRERVGANAAFEVLSLEDEQQGYNMRSSQQQGFLK